MAGVDEAITYTGRNVASRRGVAQTIGTVELTLTADRFIATTCGVGLLDRPRTVSVALAELVTFAVVPATAAQRMLGEATYDAELLLSYRAEGRLQRRRFLIDSQSPELRRILGVLAAARPEASRLDADPVEAYRETGLANPARTVKILLAVLIGVPLLISLIMIVLAATGNAA